MSMSKSKVVPSAATRSTEAEEILDASDVVEVMWDRSWASNHPSNRIPTQPAIELPLVTASLADDDDEVPTLEIPPEVVLPLLKKASGVE